MSEEKKLSEYYGTQRPQFAGGPGAGSNFYHGRDLGTHSRGSLGTRGADSNFSRRTQASVPVDYYVLPEDDELDDLEKFDEEAEIENSDYSLQETLKIIEQATYAMPDPDDNLNNAVAEILSDPTELAKFDRSMGEHAYEFGSEIILRDVASATGIGDELVGIVRIIINIFVQIRRANNELEKQEEIVEKYLAYLEQQRNELVGSETKRNKEVLTMQDHIRKLQEIQDDLYRDVSDTIQGVIALTPDDVAGPIAALESTAGKLAEILPEILQKLEIQELSELETLVREEPELEGLRYTIAFLTGIKGLSNFAPVATMGPLGIPATVLSLLNINIFNPAKILISGIRSIFVATKLQNDLLFQIQTLKSDRFEDIAQIAQSGREYSEDNLAAPDDQPASSGDFEDKKSEFLRKLFLVRRDGTDTGLFSESLENRSLAYLVERDEDLDSDPVDEDDCSEELEEFSGAGAVVMGTLPMGASTKGPKGQRSADSGGKAFPYSNKNRKAFNKYASKTFGGSK
tara:strand:- start:158 stop:1705 length:1548 start_codon:yes stop_codon:yes gene_type:complete